MAEELFLEALKREYEERKREKTTPHFRERAWERFQTLGLPQKKEEAFRYLPLTQMYLEAVDLTRADAQKEAISSTLKETTCALFAGELLMGILPKNVQLLSLEEGVKKFGHFFQNRWAQQLEKEEDPLALLNLALHRGGLFLYIPPDCSVDLPIHCLFPLQNSFNRVVIFVGARASLNFISRTLGGRWNSTVFDIALDTSSQFNHLHLVSLQEEAEHFDSFRVSLKQKSSMRSFSLNFGAKVARQDFQVQLLGEGAEVDLKGLSLLEKKRHVHTHIVMDHQKKRCRSLQKFKTALTDFAQTSFSGKILVREEAEKTEAYQLSSNLLLSDSSIANMRPTLEIFTDDVKASHGATTGYLDKEQLFYLKSRGLSTEGAKRLLVSAFCTEMLQDLSPAFFSKMSRALVAEFLENLC